MSQRDRPLGQPQLRVIGGDWRGRKLSFPSKGSLRPTTDRVRETLFNWLAPMVVEAQCLDLCAGSGALGIEALSRGAQRCDFGLHALDQRHRCGQRVVVHRDRIALV